MPPPKTAHKTACKVVHECVPTHTMWFNCSMCPHWHSDAPEHPQYPLWMEQAVKADQHHPSHDAMDHNAANTRLLYPLHMGLALDGNEHTPFQGCASTSGDCQEAPSAFWTMQKSCPLCSHHEGMLPVMTPIAQSKTTLYMCTESAPPVHPKVTQAVTTQPAHPNVAWPVHPNNMLNACTETTQPMHSKVMPHACKATTLPLHMHTMQATNLTTTIMPLYVCTMTVQPVTPCPQTTTATVLPSHPCT